MMNSLSRYLSALISRRDPVASVASEQGAAPVLDTNNNKWEAESENPVTMWVPRPFPPRNEMQIGFKLIPQVGGMSWL